MPDINSIKSINLAIIIVDRGKGKRITKLFNKINVPYQVSALGKGTAPTEMQAYFGFGETEKDIIFALISDEKTKTFNAMLTEELCTKKPKSGIAFVIPINSVSGKQELEYFLGEMEE